MANQYGFDGAKVTNTISAYKTAELAREKVSRGFEKEDAEFTEYGNYITKHNKDSITKAVDENGDGIVDANEKKNALLATGKKWGAVKDLRATDEKTTNAKNIISNRNARTGISRGHLKIAQSRLGISRAKDKRAREKAERNEKRFTDRQDLIYKNAKENGLSETEAQLLKTGGVADVKAMQALVDKGDKTTKRKVVDGLVMKTAKYGEIVDIGTGNPEEGVEPDPTRAEKKYQEIRIGIMEKLVDVGKDSDAGKVLQQRYNDMKPTILKEDGQIDGSFLLREIATNENLTQTIEEYEPKKETGQITANQVKKNNTNINKIIRKVYDVASYKNAKDKRASMSLASKFMRESNREISAELAQDKADKELKLLEYAPANSGKSGKGGDKNPVKYQVSEDKTKIYNGKKWVKYNKKK